MFKRETRNKKRETQRQGESNPRDETVRVLRDKGKSQRKKKQERGREKERKEEPERDA